MDSFDSQRAVNDQGIKDLSIATSTTQSDQNQTNNDVAHLKNSTLNGVNGSSPPVDSKPPVADINLPTPTDSADTSVPAQAIAATSNEPVIPPVIQSVAPAASVEALTDPAVQQPISESRDPPEPVSQEQAAEIIAQKEAADQENKIEHAPASVEQESATTQRQATPPTMTESSMDAMDTTGAEPSHDPVNLPHRSPAPTPNGEATEKANEPAAAPVPSVELPTPSGEIQTPADAIPSEPAPITKDEPDVTSAPNTLPAPSQDVEMKDVPPSPGKISRTRDDDGAEEPEAKRIRPSSAGDPAVGSSVAAASPANAASPSSPAVMSTGDRDYLSPITEPQMKAIATVIANTKRSTHSMAFSKPVDPVALNIPTYKDIVTQPMDLGTMNEKVKAKEYSNVQAFIDDFNLIVGNCEKFNGPNHSVTQNGYKLRETFEKQMTKVPGADYVEPPPPEKKKKTPVPRPSASRRESRAAAAPKPVATSPAAQTFALGPEGTPLIRRDSSAQDGRPRREIHPPAPKDLPYSQRPKKKKYQMELRFCAEVLKELEKPRYNGMAGPFRQPVDPVALNIPNYHKVIKKPMDLSTIRKRLDGGLYENAKEFEQDIRLIFHNCYKFNPEGDFVNSLGRQFEGEFNAIWAGKDEFVKKRQQDAGTQSPGSSPEADSDAEEEEEEEEEEEDEDNKNQQIALLQAQMQAMSQQLKSLQDAPLKKKKKPTPPASTKKKGAGKKESKKGSKESGKKSKKADKKIPFVNYEQKQDISNRINTLPENRMAQALNIIRDNMPNLKGVQEDELELDIDELSNEVLWKLLQFVRKYAPKPDDEPLESRRQSYAPTQSTKPKKNKPMGAREQESRIAELRALTTREAGAAMDNTNAESSEDDDSDDDESEEE